MDKYHYRDSSLWSYKMKLTMELCDSRRELNQQPGWTLALNAVCIGVEHLLDAFLFRRGGVLPED